jgi:hypothetical protein
MVDDTAFFDKYEAQFFDAVEVINRLIFYDGFCKSFPAFKKLTSLEWYNFQKDWIRLNKKLTHPLDLDFFKPSWVPLSANEYEFYIDLEDASGEVFGIGYYNGQISSWFKYPVFNNCKKIIELVENFDHIGSAESFDLTDIKDFSDNIFEKVLFERLKHNADVEFSDKYRALALKEQQLIKEGKLKRKPISDYSYFISYEESSVLSTHGKLTLKGISPFVVDLIPNEVEILITEWISTKENSIEGDELRNTDDVKTADDLVNLVCNTGSYYLVSFKAIFVENPNYLISYSDSSLNILHENQQLLNEIERKFISKRNSISE